MRALFGAFYSLVAVLLAHPWVPSAEAQPVPDGPTITMVGFGQQQKQVAVAYIIENINPDYGYEAMPVQVSVFDAQGAPIGSSSGYVDMLFPAGKTAHVSRIYFQGDEQAARVNVSIGKGRAQRSTAQPALSARDVIYKPDRFFPKATGIVSSSYVKNATYVYVAAVAFDATGSIIGGGFEFLNFVPAGGEVVADPAVTTSGQPAWIEMYASLSGLSRME
jgi:hypothetical protein